jgi:Uma2 family endonuclease
MNSTTRLMTADELFLLPSNGHRYELAQGELRTMSPAGFEHGAIGFNLAIPLGQHVAANQLGILVGTDIGFVLSRDPDTVRAPDLALVSRARIQELGVPQKFFPGAPDLAGRDHLAQRHLWRCGRED